MDYEAYRKKHFTDPAPQPRFEFSGLMGYALYLQDYQAALDFYTEVLGQPAYVEGEFTHGWQLGNAWLTLFPAQEGKPSSVEVHLKMAAPGDVDKLHAAFLAAGAEGPEPSDELMYEPLRFAMVTDPFGTQFLIVAKRD